MKKLTIGSYWLEPSEFNQKDIGVAKRLEKIKKDKNEH